jgi:hypothetical protein
MFGRLHTRSLLGHAVQQFFDNGGTDARVLRIVEPGAATAACDIGSLHVEASSPGAWANGLSVRVTRSAADPQRFGLEVMDAAGAVLESFDDLSLRADDPRFAPDVVGETSLLLGALTVASSDPPPEGLVALDVTTAGSGEDLEPNDADMLAGLAASFGPGGLVDGVEDAGLYCVPGLTDAPTVATLQRAAARNRAFLLLDCAEDDTAASIAGALAGGTGPDAGNSALYFPWVMARDPAGSGVRAFPPSGFVAGVIARTDARRGVWKAPAGREASLVGGTGLAQAVGGRETEMLNGLGVNCLRVMPRSGPLVWGSRTLGSDPEYRYVPVRRTALFIEASLARGLQWAVFEPNAGPLWARIRQAVEAFLDGLFRQGGFQGRTAREAYFVRCDRTTTSQTDVDAGIVRISVGFAPLRPAEFVVLTIRQIAGQNPPPS